VTGRRVYGRSRRWCLTRRGATKDSSPSCKGYAASPKSAATAPTYPTSTGGTDLADNWYQGNATADGDQYRGWLLGHFIDPAAHGIRHTGDLEVKWGIHPPPARRAPAAGTTGETRTPLLMLISGNGARR
jgi:hypothetical protein